MNSLNINCTTKMTYLYILIGLNEFVVEKKGSSRLFGTHDSDTDKTSDTDKNLGHRLVQYDGQTENRTVVKFILKN